MRHLACNLRGHGTPVRDGTGNEILKNMFGVELGVDSAPKNRLKNIIKSAQISPIDGLPVRFLIWRSGWDSNPRDLTA